MQVLAAVRRSPVNWDYLIPADRYHNDAECSDVCTAL